MGSESNVLEYRLISLKRQASGLEDLRRDVDIMETYLKECLGEKKIPDSCDLDCLLELQGLTLTRKQTKFDYLQEVNNLQKENAALKKKLMCSQNATELRNQAQKKFDKITEQILAMFPKENEKDTDTLTETTDTLTNLFNKIYNVIADKADINRKMREKDSQVESLQGKLREHCAILSCIKHKKGTNENLIEASELKDTYKKWKMENKELQEKSNQLSEAYKNILSEIQGLKEMGISQMNKAARKSKTFHQDLVKKTQFQLLTILHDESSRTFFSRGSCDEVDAFVPDEKEQINKLKNCVNYLQNKYYKLTTMIRRRKFDKLNEENNIEKKKDTPSVEKKKFFLNCKCDK